jgi:hypothetical protein
LDDTQVGWPAWEWQWNDATLTLSDQYLPQFLTRAADAGFLHRAAGTAM